MLNFSKKIYLAKVFAKMAKISLPQVVQIWTEKKVMVFCLRQFSNLCISLQMKVNIFAKKIILVSEGKSKVMVVDIFLG